jgi:hypothetical protein
MPRNFPTGSEIAESPRDREFLWFYRTLCSVGAACYWSYATASENHALTRGAVFKRLNN